MPTLRSHISCIKPKLNVTTMNKVEKEQDQWMMIAPVSVCSQDAQSDVVLIHKLPHPQSGTLSLFAFHQKKCYELIKFKEPFRSWFIDNTVQKDGSLTMFTSVDPLFLALPYFDKAAQQDKYTTLDNILIDEKNPTAIRELECCLTKKQLLNICSCKGDEDFIVYKTDEDKIIKWLSEKVRRLASHLKKSDVNVVPGGQISGFSKTSAGNKSENDCLRYACAMVSDYVNTDRSERLKETLKIKDQIKETNEELTPASKKQKLDNVKEDCLEDYRDFEKTKNKKPARKLTATQKSLQKVDKKGMKSMTSFFVSKAKK